jgi:hypothetical protein
MRVYEYSVWKIMGLVEVAKNKTVRVQSYFPFYLKFSTIYGQS